MFDMLQVEEKKREVLCEMSGKWDCPMPTSDAQVVVSHGFSKSERPMRFENLYSSLSQKVLKGNNTDGEIAW